MKRVLVVRNDKIGDFMLAWPAFAMLKLSMPEVEVCALVPGYTAPLARLCPWIDRVVTDPGKRAERSEQKALLRELRELKCSAAICIFSNTRNALLVKKARIPERWAPATKLAQFLYNHRVVQRRSRSEKPESEYNLDLVRAFLQYQQRDIVEPLAPYLTIPPDSKTACRLKVACELELDANSPWALVHSGSGGSANNLSLQQYAGLIATLAKQQPQCQWLLTAGPGEEDQTQKLAELCRELGVNVALYISQGGLEQFCEVIANGALFIAGSTGPLHIAGALDVPTIGFFPSRRSATPLRWQPLNSDGNHQAFAPPRGRSSNRICPLFGLLKLRPVLSLGWLSG